MSENANLNRRLKGLMAERRAILVPGAANALAARVIEDVGYEAVFITGAGVTNMFLGSPDMGLITLTEIADHLFAIRDAVDLPIIVDADTGFGNAINMTRTVQVLERSGANAIQIEDQVMPKKCGHFSGKVVVTAAEMVQKIRAAVDSRRDGDFQVIARTDALQAQGLDAALDRASAYIDAGADATFVEAPRTGAELADIPKRLPAPQVANMVFGGATPLQDQATLAEHGFSIVLYANVALQSALHGMRSALTALKHDGSLDNCRDLLMPFEERQRFVRKPSFDALEERYSAKKG